MAFALVDFGGIGGQSSGGNHPKIWSYTTTDTLATCDGAGYFNDASNLVSIGDLIYVLVTSSGALSDAGWLVVATNASGVVDTTDQSVITVVDSD